MLLSGGRETPWFLLCHLCTYHLGRNTEECFITGRQQLKPSVFAKYLLIRMRVEARQFYAVWPEQGNFLKSFFLARLFSYPLSRESRPGLGGEGAVPAFFV